LGVILCARAARPRANARINIAEWFPFIDGAFYNLSHYRSKVNTRRAASVGFEGRQ